MDGSSPYSAVGVAEAVISYGPHEPLLLHPLLDFHDQPTGRAAEGLSKFENDSQCGRFDPPFDLADIGPVDACLKP